MIEVNELHPAGSVDSTGWAVVYFACIRKITPPMAARTPRAIRIQVVPSMIHLLEGMSRFYSGRSSNSAFI